MANTVIQLKYSNVTGTPPTLNVSEPAYSNVSNKLWINDGSGVVAIGGKHFTQIIDAATSNAAANTLVLRNTSGHIAANIVNATSVISTGPVYQNGIDLGDKANAAFAAANTAIAEGGAAAYAHANASFNKANTSFDNSAAASSYANSAYLHANASYAHANTKFASSGGTISGDVTVTGNLTIQGNTVTASVDTYIVNDPIVLYANNNSGNSVDLGFVAHYVEDATTKHTGLIKDVSENKFYLFENYEPHVQEEHTLNIANPSLAVANLVANLITDSALIRGYDPINHANSAFAAANTADQRAVTSGAYANAAFAVANTADQRAVTSGDYANSAYVQANTATVLAQAAFDVANTDVTNISTTAGIFGSASIVPVFSVAANGRVTGVINTSIQVDASAIISGNVSVSRGGTGKDFHTVNSVLLGNGSDAFGSAYSSTEGHVLTINSSGVPTFAHLNGGSF